MHGMALCFVFSPLPSFSAKGVNKQEKKRYRDGGEETLKSAGKWDG